MKRLINLIYNNLVWLIFLCFLAIGISDFVRVRHPTRVFAQGTPQCSQLLTFTAATAGASIAAIPPGGTNGCSGWRLTFTVTGFTGATVQFEGSQDNTTFNAIGSSYVLEGVNPTVWTSSTVSNTIVVRAYLPYMRVNITSVTGSGTIKTTLYGYIGTSAQLDLSGGGSGASGPSGPAGPTGATGPAGASGPSGPAGASGPSGAAGATGATGPSGPSGGAGAANPFCTFSTTATGCGTPTSISVASLGATTTDQFLVQCFTGASTTQTPVTILTYVYTTSGGVIQTVAPTFASAAAAGYCVANATGSAGPSGPSGPSGGGGGGGSFVLVEEHTANNSSAELDFTTCFSSTYDDYEIRVLNLLTASSAQRVLWQAHSSGSYDTGSNYQWVMNFQLAGSGGASSDGSASDTGVQWGPGQLDTSATWGGISGDFRVQNPAGGASQYVGLTGQSVQKDGRDSVLNGRNLGAFYKSSAAVDGFRVVTTSGNLAAGTVRCYGLTH